MWRSTLGRDAGGGKRAHDVRALGPDRPFETPGSRFGVRTFLAGTLLLAGMVILCGRAAATQERGFVWLGADGRPLQFSSESELVEFLREARVVEDLSQVGVTSGARKILLERGGVRIHAVFRHLDERRTRFRFRRRTHPFWRDSYVFECAAYRLDRLLGLDRVPPTVLRSVRGERGSVQAWIEGAVTEDERERRGMTPPDRAAWLRQWEEMELFDQIVFNLDRNQGNLLVDRHWRLWLVDHSLAFRRYGYLEDVDDLERVERGVWRRLQALDESTVREHLGPFLEEAELEGLVERLGGVVAHFRDLIRKRGESAVVYDEGRAREDATSEPPPVSFEGIMSPSKES